MLIIIINMFVYILIGILSGIGIYASGMYLRNMVLKKKYPLFRALKNTCNMFYRMFP